jgi:catechol 2,3-dioxygenase-like lactoylglutathione lyase family enzyme
VDDLDRAVELFTVVLGLPLVSRAASQLVVGEVAVIDAGSLLISLLHPASSGEGSVLAERSPRLSQLFFAAGDPPDPAAVLDRAIAAGLSVVPGAGGSFHVTPESVEGAVGQPVAIVMAAVDER